MNIVNAVNIVNVERAVNRAILPAKDLNHDFRYLIFINWLFFFVILPLDQFRFVYVDHGIRDIHDIHDIPGFYPSPAFSLHRTLALTRSTFCLNR